MSSQEIRAHKQQYLRVNILEKQYDAEQFVDFCNQVKGSIDIDAWSFQELEQMVRDFISCKSKKEQVEELIPQQPIIEQQKNYDQNPISPQVQSKSPSPDKISMFDNWTSVIPTKQLKKQQQIKIAQKQIIKQSQQNKTNFDLIDLNFLQAMSSNSNKINLQIQKPIINKNTKDLNQNNYLILPVQVAKKLQQENNIIQNYNKNISNLNIINNNSNSNSNSNSINNNNNNQIKKQKNISTIQHNKKIQSDNKSNLNESFMIDLETRIVQKKCGLSQNHEIIVSHHKIINPNIFIPNYVLYTITNIPNSIEVQRRMKDLEQLRNTLIKLFPTVQIPHLQRYNRLSQTDPNVIKKQRLYIQSFINNLLLNKQIRCKLIEDFLTCQDQVRLRKIFQDYERIQRPKSIETLFTINGKVSLNLNVQNKKYLNQQNSYIDFLQGNLGRLRSLYDQLTTGFMQNVRTINEIAQIYDILQQNMLNINKSFSAYKSINIEQTFGKLKASHQEWSENIKCQSKIIENELRHMFKFQYSNANTLKQILKIVDNMQQYYQKRCQKQSSNDDQYLNKKLDDYKVDINYPSKHIKVLKYQTAYHQYNTVKQCLKYHNQLSNKFNVKFSSFSKMQLHISKESIRLWQKNINL